MAVLKKVRTHRHVTVTLKDGTGSPITVEVGPGPGDLKLSGMQEANKEAVKILDRGGFQELVYGDDLEISFSVTVYHSGDLTVTGSVHDALNKTGDFASGVSTETNGAQAWCLDLLVTILLGGVTNTYALSKCRISWDYAEAKDGNTISLSGTCYGGVTVT